MAETIDRPTAGQADPQTTALHLGNFKAFGGAQSAAPSADDCLRPEQFRKEQHHSQPSLRA